MHHLDKGQRVGRGATAAAHTLLKQCHCKFLVGYAVLSSTYILFGFISNMEVNSHQEVFKAFCSIIHNPQLEALFILESLCQSTAESVGRKHFFTTTLKLVKDALSLHYRSMSWCMAGTERGEAGPGQTLEYPGGLHRAAARVDSAL